jgi:hypothetical protein
MEEWQHEQRLISVREYREMKKSGGEKNTSKVRNTVARIMRGPGIVRLASLCDGATSESFLAAVFMPCKYDGVSCYCWSSA